MSPVPFLVDAQPGSNERQTPRALVSNRGVKAGCWRLAEVGFILHPDHWGQGLATEALSAAIPHVFATLAVEALTAEVDPRNAASLRVLDRLGFRETHRAARTILVGDEWCDSVYLQLPRAA